MGSDDRSRPSWRDIDKRRESGKSSDEPRGAGALSRSQEEQRQKQYRAALEQAFERGELGKLAEKLSLPSRTPLPSLPTTSSASQSNLRGGLAVAPPSPSAVDASPGTASPPAVPEKSSPKKKKDAEDRPTLRKRLLEAVGKKEISKAAEKLLAKHELPDDHEVLEQLLEHERESRVAEAIGRMVRLLDRGQQPKRSRALCGKLRYLSETTADGELKQAAQGLLIRLT
jgi:hypothetical protein